MGSSEGRAEASHKRILEHASRLVRRRGIAPTSVDEVMGAAGLTRGGFYAHFRDKTAMVVEALQVAFGEARKNLLNSIDAEGEAWLERATERYLSEAHVEHPERGCAVPTLTAEVNRAEAPLRGAYRREVLAMISLIEERLGGRDARARAIGVFSAWIGGLVLARAVGSKAAPEVLAAARAAALRAGAERRERRT